eukprot:COSAG03_NODE_57_length_15795_cov_83.762784_15_plen_209_part_00
MGAVGSGPFAGNDVNRRRNLVTGYTKYNTYTRITQLNQLNYDTRCSLSRNFDEVDSSDAGARTLASRLSAGGQTTEPSAGGKPAVRAKKQYMNVSNHWRPMIRPVAEAPRHRRRRRAIRRRRRGSARTKNGHSARADAVSMGPNALDQENRDAQTCVRSGQISPGRRCVPRQWQCHQNIRSRVHRTPLRRGWDCPRSLAVVACRSLFG